MNLPRLLAPATVFTILALSQVGTAAASPADDLMFKVDEYVYMSNYDGVNSDQRLHRTEAGDFGISDVHATTFGSAAFQPAPAAFTSVLVGSNGEFAEAQTLIMMEYAFTVTGPQAMNVPVIVVGRTELTQSGPTGSSYASAQVLGPIPYGSSLTQNLLGNSWVSCAPDGLPGNTGCGDQSFHFAFDLMAGTSDAFGDVAEVDLVSRASAYADYYYPADFTSRSYAFIDPLITVDPAFLALHPGYTVVQNPQVANALQVSGVPEPATWLSMVVGLAGIGGRLRRVESVQRASPRSRRPK